MSTKFASDFEFLRPRWERNTDKSDADGCWPWLLKPDGFGYGQLTWPKNQVIRAHQLSYLLHKGDIPSGVLVRHTCDNPICVRPDHLILGTKADNLDDARTRGRWHNKKKPEVPRAGTRGPKPREIAERFPDLVVNGEPDECWPFSGTKDRNGYGRFGIPGRGRNASKVYAHRVAWELAFGEIPNGLIVMHTCDNPPCCNPAHLRLGTLADNNRDRSAKGRGRENRQWGSQNPAAKLSEDDVLMIRTLARDGVVQARIAERFGIKQAQVSKIVRGLSWADGPWPE